MATTPSNLFSNPARSDWVRIQTLVFLRWLAIAGQISAVLICHFVLEIGLNFLACCVVISASVLFNLVSRFIFQPNQRLPERAALFSLLFDLIQLVLLLFLTGGLNNPFALLLLAPVTISATALTFTSTIFIGFYAISATTFLRYFYLPITLSDGTFLEMPPLFLTGAWVALIIGFVFLSAYARRVSVESFNMSQALAATQMALDREHKLDILGGVVAAAAHEMGTPLATIKMAATELEEELEGRSELQDDARLIRQETDRLKDILRDMGKSGKDDLILKAAPFLTVLQEALQPHEARGKIIHVFVNGAPLASYNGQFPSFPRLPEIIHGIRNLAQNAVDFADANVWADISWTENDFFIEVSDDGPGFPNDYLDRLGDPFLRRATKLQQKKREGYEGMGLGLFIAKTLLERTGAVLSFSNGAPSKEKCGAKVLVKWERKTIEKQAEKSGPNPRFNI